MKNTKSVSVRSQKSARSQKLVQYTPTPKTQKLIEASRRKGESLSQTAARLFNEAMGNFLRGAAESVTVRLDPKTMSCLKAEAERLGCTIQDLVDRNCPAIIKVWLPMLFELDRARAEHRLPRESSLAL